jgi:hypothetical protein
LESLLVLTSCSTPGLEKLMGGNSQNTQSASTQASNSASNSLTDFLTQALSSYVQNTAQNTASNTAQNTASNQAQNTAATTNQSSTADQSQNTAANTATNALSNTNQSATQNNVLNTNATTAQNSNQSNASNTTGTTDQNSLSNFGQNTTGNVSSTSTYDPSAAAKSLISSGSAPASSSIANYTNPYQQNVTDATMAQLGQMFGQQRTALQGNAISQNALGGDRAKIAQAVLAGEQGRTAASTLSGLNQTGYTQALTAAQADAARQLQAAGLSGGTTTGGQQTASGTTGQTAASSTGQTASGTTGTSNIASLGQTQSGTTEQGSSTVSGQTAANTTGTSNAATTGTSNANTIGQTDTSMLGQSNLSSLGATNSATQGTTAGTNATNTAGATGTSTAAASSGAGSGSQATTQQPGMGSYLGMGLTALSMMSNGGPIRRADGGGLDSATGRYVLWPNAISKMQATPFSDPKQWNSLQDLGHKARGGLDQIFSSINGDGEPGKTGIIGKLSDFGSSWGLASGGTAAKADGYTSLASMPRLPAAMAATPYLPAAVAATPYVMSPQVAMPTLSALSLPQTSVAMPTVPTASVPEAHVSSSGKASGGAVRGFADGGSHDDGLARLIAGFRADPAPDANADFSGAYAPFESPEQQQYKKFGMPWQSPPPPSESPAMADVRGPGIAVADETPKGIGALGDANFNLQDAYPMANSKGNPEQPVRYEPGGSNVLPPLNTPYAPQTVPAASGFGGMQTQPEEAPAGIGSFGLTPSDQPIPVKTEVFRTSPDDLARSGDQPHGLGALGETAVPDVPMPAAADQESKPPTYFTSISGPMETGQVDPLKGVGNISSDTNKSRSYGNYGLNSQRGASAWQFRNQYGAEIGLTANPGTPEFDRQWKAAAANDPEKLQALENDWWQNNIAKGVRSHMEQAGVPEEMAADPRVQAYMADREVQQGTGSTINHAARVQQAAEAANGDPETFMRVMSEGDKAHLGSDFRTYLSQHPDAKKGLTNRVDRRLAASMGVDSTPTTFAGITPPTGADKTAVAGTLSRVVAPLAAKGESPDIAPVNKYVTPSDQQTGGLLKRFFGIDFNPLKLTPKERKTMFMAGAAMMSTGNVGTGLFMGAQTQMKQQQLDRQAKLDAMKIRMDFAKLSQPVVIGETVDPATGATRKQYGSFDMGSGKYVPAAPGAGSVPQVDYLAPEMPAEEAVKAAPPAIATMAKKYANYELPVPSTARKNPQMLAALSLAEKINPGFSQQEYKAQQALKTGFTSGKDADEVKSYSTVMHHVASADAAVDAMGNTRSSMLNAPLNAVRGQMSSQFIKAKAAAENGIDTAISEYNRATSGKPITVDERQAWRGKLSENSSPEAMHATYKSFMEYISGRMHETAAKFNNGFHLSPDDPRYKTPETMLSPAALKEYRRLSGTAPAQGDLSAARPTGVSRVEQARQQMRNTSTAPQQVPTAGTIYKGYRFKGGDPAQQSNWEAAR